MENSRKFAFIALNLLLVAVTVYLILFFENSVRIEEIRFLPRKILIALLIYILAQVVKRSVLGRREKYDWLYYIGLVVILMPVFLPNLFSFEIFKNSIRIGMLSFLIGPIIDTVKILRYER